MKTADDQTNELKQWTQPAATVKTARLAAIEKLPKKLHACAYALMQCNPDGTLGKSKDPKNRRLSKRENAKEIESLKSADRTRLFAAFFPNMADALEGAWQKLAEGPYSTGWYMKPFRAAGHSEMSLDSHYDAIQSTIHGLSGFRPEIITAAWLAPRTEAVRQHANVTVSEAEELLDNDEDEEPDDTDTAATIRRLLLRQITAVVQPEPILAAAIDAGDDETLDILRQILNREHEIGEMGRYVIQSLLMSSREEAWELVVGLLLAAQRQEGLRQEILESAPFADPGAFRRLLAVILEHDLVRFSAVARAVDLWLGWGWDSASTKIIRDGVATLVEFLGDRAAIDAALLGDDPVRVSLALWCLAFEDAPASIPPAEALLSHEMVEMRFVAVRHLATLDLPQTARACIPAIDDPDLRVALAAMQTAMAAENGELDLPAPSDVNAKAKTKKKEPWRLARFEALEHLYERTPAKPKVLEALVWPWTERKADRREVAAALASALGDLPPTRLLPYLKMLSPWTQRREIEKWGKQKTWDPLTRQTMIELAGHASEVVRGAAFEALDKKELTDEELLVMENYLRRKSADLRQNAFSQLLRQKDPGALASADRLLAAKNAPQRLAGLETLRRLAEGERALDEVRERAEAYGQKQKKLSREENVQIEAITKSGGPTWTLENGLGLMNPAGRTPIRQPVERKAKPVTTAATKCLESLDALIHEHRETIIITRDHYGDDVQEMPLGAVEPYRFPRFDSEKGAESQREKLPLADVWTQWSAGRAKSLRDADGLELVRARSLAEIEDDSWRWDRLRTWCKKKKHDKLFERLAGPIKKGKSRKYPGHVQLILDWLLFLDPPPGWLDFTMDLAETSYALVPAPMMENLKPAKSGERVSPYSTYMTNDYSKADWRSIDLFDHWAGERGRAVGAIRENITTAQHERAWHLAHFLDEPFPGALRRRPGLNMVVQAHANGWASDDDLVDQLVGPNNQGEYGGRGFHELSNLTEPSPEGVWKKQLQESEFLRQTVERIRHRALEIELARGEAETPATNVAVAIRSLRGLETLIRVFTAIDSAKFKPASRWSYSGGTGRAAVFTHLLRVTHPAEGDTPELFAKRMRELVKHGLCDEQRIVELAFLAPQWTRHVEEFLGWKGFAEGLYWFLAHMDEYQVGGAANAAAVAEGTADEQDVDDEDDEDMETGQRRISAWERLVLERTPLTRDERAEGAVDVAWCRRTWKVLGEKRWEQLADAARYAANTAQAKKAKFLSDTLLGKTDRAVLVKGIEERKLKENVRQLGLLPLAGTKAQQRKDLLERYEILQGYRKYAKTLSGLTKPAAMRAADIGFDNLARLAGYADPLRLEWAMEAESVKDLAQGPVSETAAGVTVTLALDDQARPEIEIRRGEKSLKSVPAALKKKTPKIAELLERGRELKRKSSRTKQSLEAAMCRGDVFTGAELAELGKHALLAPLLSRLILVGEGIVGYPDKQGRVLRSHDGTLEPVKKNEELSIAHPHDLLATKEWDRWQRECFAAERVQPFKQVFRELYVVTKQEQRDGTRSQRFAGQQINPRQAMALWGSRGWNTSDEVFKVFHDLGIIAQVDFEYGWGTPMEVEGLTLRDISFRRRDDYQPLPLKEVPPAVFSEVMRDTDLVVSVAHRGEVDPEASASTVEMRAALLRETCGLLSLANVRLNDSHALIDGHHANYSVHLGSATVHRLPGGSVCIVPVHAQHRGRLFLPFADDDPRTAEVVSKVLLLARDEEIMDPGILEQLRA